MQHQLSLVTLYVKSVNVFIFISNQPLKIGIMIDIYEYNSTGSNQFYNGLFKSKQVAKINPYYIHFASTSRGCTYAHIPSAGQYCGLFYIFFQLLSMLHNPLFVHLSIIQK